MDFTNNIKGNIKNENKKVQSNNNVRGTGIFTIKKKKEDKNENGKFIVYIATKKLEELDKLAKRTGYSRNELVNNIIDFCLENYKIED